MNIAICDQLIHGARTSAGTLWLETGRITARELIRRRIEQEVETYNQNLPEVFAGLVQPEQSERLLNGYRVKTRQQLDAAQQFQRACSSFANNGFLLLVDGRQVTALDDELDLANGSEVDFLKLVPLIGG